MRSLQMDKSTLLTPKTWTTSQPDVAALVTLYFRRLQLVVVVVTKKEPLTMARRAEGGERPNEYQLDLSLIEVIEGYYNETQPFVLHEARNPPVGRSRVRSTSTFCEQEGVKRARFESLWKKSDLNTARKMGIPFEKAKPQLLAEIERRKQMRKNKALDASQSRGLSPAERKRRSRKRKAEKQAARTELEPPESRQETSAVARMPSDHGSSNGSSEGSSGRHSASSNESVQKDTSSSAGLKTTGLGDDDAEGKADDTKDEETEQPNAGIPDVEAPQLSASGSLQMLPEIDEFAAAPMPDVHQDSGQDQPADDNDESVTNVSLLPELSASGMDNVGGEHETTNAEHEMDNPMVEHDSQVHSSDMETLLDTLGPPSESW